MTDKIKIEKMEQGKMYDFTVFIMGREELLLTHNELKELQHNLLELVGDGGKE